MFNKRCICWHKGILRYQDARYNDTHSVTFAIFRITKDFSIESS